MMFYLCIAAIIKICASIPIVDTAPTDSLANQPARVRRSSSNRTSPTSTEGWRQEPNTRGTYGILSSCIITLVLCVWSALHLNVPPPFREGKMTRNLSRLRIKIIWVLIGLFAPEVVVYIAVMQRRKAQELKVRINERFKELANAGNSNYRPWSLVHCFYAIMGGFVVEIPKEKTFVPERYGKHLTLTPEGILYLLENAPSDHVFNEFAISIESIYDKSKADNVTKALACIQSSWMIIQCSARVAAQLPITLLELSTIGHVICALLLFYLWWEKPLEVHEPSVILIALDKEWLREHLAYMYMASNLSCCKRRMWGMTWSFESCEFSSLRVSTDWVDPRAAASSQATSKADVSEFRQHDHESRSNASSAIALGTSVGPSNDIGSGDSNRDDSQSHGQINSETKVISPGRRFSAPGLGRKISHPRWPRAIQAKQENSELQLDTGEMVSLAGDKLTETSLVDEVDFQGLVVNTKPEMHEDCIHEVEDTRESWNWMPLPPTSPDAIISVCDSACPPTIPFKPYCGGQFGKKYRNVFFRRPDINWRAKPREKMHVLVYPVVYLDEVAVRRWMLARRAIPEGHTETISYTRDMLDVWAVNGKTIMFPTNAFQLLAIAIATAAYGGLHTLAWNNFFLSNVERTLWRLSALVVAISGILAAIGCILMFPTHGMKHPAPVEIRNLQQLFPKWAKIRRIRWVVLRILIYRIMELATIIPCFLFVFSRLYMLFEAFISLRRQPVEVYDVPIWSQLLPHI